MLYLENRFGQKENGITLSTAISVEDAEGAEIKVEDPERQLDFEAPLPRDADLSNLEVRKSLVRFQKFEPSHSGLRGPNL